MGNAAVVTIGVFDGVHCGHQALITRTVEQARSCGYRAVVVTFDPNPMEVLRPDQAPTRLVSMRRREELIRELGVDEVEVLAFTPEMAAMSAEHFTHEVLIDRLQARGVVIGHGFRFGHRAQGTSETLRANGLEVEEYALLGSGTPISSTRIRAAIAEGDVEEASAMLGRLPEVEGRVVQGAQRGRDLGYPTANIEHHRLAAVPADGVYAGLADVDGCLFAAAISVGSNPTFEGTQRTVEAHLLDFSADLYDREMRVGFATRLRAMETFADVQSLIERMAGDVERARQVAAQHLAP